MNYKLNLGKIWLFRDIYFSRIVGLLIVILRSSSDPNIIRFLVRFLKFFDRNSNFLNRKKY